MTDKSEKDLEATNPAAPQQETFAQRLKRLSQNTQNGHRFVKGSSLGPITVVSVGSSQVQGHGKAEPDGEASEEVSGEPVKEQPKEFTEEEKVRELEAYQKHGQEGIREVLRRRNEEYLQQQQNRLASDDPGSTEG